MTKRTKAYSYTRFSTPDQRLGDSARRQMAAAEDYARRHDLDLDTSLTFDDPGVSAFRGKNVEDGGLGAFLKAVEKGVVPQGSFLLVENLDRVSRQTARKALRSLERIVEAGIVLVTLTDGKQYTEQSLDGDPVSLLLTILTFVRAHEESALKGRRVRAAWDNKRRRAQEEGVPLTKRTPGWLVLGANGKLRLDRSRAAIVRRIFKMALSGIGQNAIAARLNQERVKPFNADMWHRSYVKKLLDNPAVTGRLIAHRVEFENGRKVRKPVLELEGHFPAVVSQDEWKRVQELRGGIGPSGLRPAPKGTAPLQNILAGLARCPRCAGTMTRISKGPGGGYAYLTCARAKAKAGCEYRNIRMADVEQAVWEQLDAIVGTIPTGDDATDTELHQIETALDILKEQAGRLASAIAQRGMTGQLGERLDAVEKEMRALEAEEKTILESLEDAPLLDMKVRELREALEAQAPDRQRVNALLRQMTRGVTVDYDAGQLVFEWRHGGSSYITFAMAERPAEL